VIVIIIFISRGVSVGVRFRHSNLVFIHYSNDTAYESYIIIKSYYLLVVDKVDCAIGSYKTLTI
jgi:hypothetical protein